SRQPDRLFRRPEHGVRPARKQPAPGRHPGGGDRIGRGVGAESEPVDDDEDDRAGPPHALAARRAAAVTPARPTIPAISSGLSEAPPTRAPSIPGSVRSSPMFAAVTLPP